MTTTSTKPRRLGRGLSSLISEPVPIETEVSNHQVTQLHDSSEVKSDGGGPEPSNGLGLVQLAIDLIDPSPFQPRFPIQSVTLEGLAASVKQSGVMQPVIVRPGAGGRFELVAGERRWRAAEMAGLPRIPAVVRALSDEESAEWALVENLQREDLDPIERAVALRRLSEQFGLSHGELADRVGLERSTVANLVRLTELEEAVASLISTGQLGAGHGKALLGAPPGEKRIELAERAAQGEWSVRRLEEAVRRLTSPEPEPERPASAERQELEKRLSEHLGTKVAVRTDQSGTRGRVVIEFYGLDHFDGLMSRLGFRLD